MTEQQTTIGARFQPDAIEADGFHIRFYRAGAGEPLTVLHHAGGPRFTVALDLLAEHHDVVVFEMPGWGEDVNERTESISELAATMAAAIEAADLAPCHLLGSSLGGATAIRLAEARPDLVRSLVLEAPAELRVGQRPVAELGPDEYTAAFRTHPEREPRWDPPAPDRMAVLGPLLRKLLGGPQRDDVFVERLERCNVRTLVLFGNDDGVIPPANGPTYVELLPDARLVVLDGAAHDIQGDRPQDFAALVLAFLAGDTLPEIDGASTMP